MSKTNPLMYILGGGKGERLHPLTRDRAKPAVPFGGNYRIIDFVLSNMYHSGIRKSCILTQYESRPLHRHIKHGWYPRFGIGVDEFILTLPATKSQTGGWYRGTADAIIQNKYLIEDEEPDIVDVFGGDHIYVMDISQMNNFHLEKEADLTISAIPVKRDLAARRYGVIVADTNGIVSAFEEKPENPTPMLGKDEYCLASMGNYAFRPDVLLEELAKDADKKTSFDIEAISANPDNLSSHDIGFDIIPLMLRAGKKIFVYNFMENSVRGEPQKEKCYWRDIGDLDQFYEANMEIRSAEPPLNLYNPKWLILTNVESHQPTKFIGCKGEAGRTLDSIVADGVIIKHANVERSVLSYNIKIEDDAQVTDSILLGYTEVGKGVIIKDSIIDRGVKIPEEEKIGIDKNKDKDKGFTISPKGITVVPRNYVFK